jgi:hypothetical protein
LRVSRAVRPSRPAEPSEPGRLRAPAGAAGPDSRCRSRHGQGRGRCAFLTLVTGQILSTSLHLHKMAGILAPLPLDAKPV